MLKQLYIENIAVIERADIAFGPGFNVLSGETGAGKSIIIDALNALSGARISRDLIRLGQQKAYVSATFSALSEQTLRLAEEQGFAPEEGELILTRELYLDGRNICRIGGRPATVGVLKLLSPLLFGIHGQHDGQHLLNELLHIDYLDAYAGLSEAVAEYQASYETLLSLNRDIRASVTRLEEQERRAEVLAFQRKELEAAAPEPGEYSRLMQLRRELVHGEKITEAYLTAIRAFQGQEDGEEGLLTALIRAQNALGSIEELSDKLPALNRRMGELALLADDLSHDISLAFSQINYSPELREETERRLELLSRLSKKHAVPADELSALRGEIEIELALLAQAGDDIEQMKREYAGQRETVYQQAERISQRRNKAARGIERAIERELGELGMSGARFSVELNRTVREEQIRFTRKGTDQVRFLMAANRGEGLKSLSKVASGGELSRIMLAIKSILSAGDGDVCDIFDEIDSGVSGHAANRVGEKLVAMSMRRQVICITHLPQIAAMADRHYNISKTESAGRTYTSVTLLDSQGRADELSRLTGGRSVTETTLESAREMMRQAEEYKTSLKQAVPSA